MIFGWPRRTTSAERTDERFHKLSTDYEAEQAGLVAQAAMPVRKSKKQKKQKCQCR